MRNHRGEIAECSQSNLFIVKSGTAFTPPIDAGLPRGITREFLFEVAEEMGVPMAESVMRDEDLLGADEAFLTSTTREVVPIVLVDEHRIGTGHPGPVTRALLEGFRRRADLRHERAQRAVGACRTRPRWAVPRRSSTGGCGSDRERAAPRTAASASRPAFDSLQPAGRRQPFRRTCRPTARRKQVPIAVRVVDPRDAAARTCSHARTAAETPPAGASTGAATRRPTPWRRCAARSSARCRAHPPCPTTTAWISPRIAIIASQNRSSSSFGSLSVGSIISVPGTGNDTVGAWKP